jgi:hypothetical protein
MNSKYIGPMTTAFVLTVLSGQALFVNAQTEPSRPNGSASGNAEESERRKILESDRWRRAYRRFNQWLSVQQVYSADQIASVKAELKSKVAKMSARELENFLEDMEDRLEVLTSPEAEDARTWLAQFFAVARNPEAQLGRSRPDVLNMTASEIRQEILWLQQHRASRQQQQAAFNQSRAQQQQFARAARESRREAQTQAAELRSRAAGTQFRSQFAPPSQDRSGHSELRPQPMGAPLYGVSPWGTPIYWHPMRGQW